MNVERDYNARAVALVPCTYCGAGIGEPCRGARGVPVKSTHYPRRSDATKKVREERVLRSVAVQSLYRQRR